MFHTEGSQPISPCLTPDLRIDGRSATCKTRLLTKLNLLPASLLLLCLNREEARNVIPFGFQACCLARGCGSGMRAVLYASSGEHSCIQLCHSLKSGLFRLPMRLRNLLLGDLSEF